LLVAISCQRIFVLIPKPQLLHCASSFLQFVNAVMARWPGAVLQFEDFQMAHALTLLQRYRHHHLVFNDDIQVRVLPYTCMPVVDLCRHMYTGAVVLNISPGHVGMIHELLLVRLCAVVQCCWHV
jgi:hypothetical protein